MNFKIKYKVLLADLAIIFSALLVGIFLSINLELSALTIVLFSLWTGFWIHSLFLYVHEAAHYNLHQDKVKNDFIANIFSRPIFATSMDEYRKKHWEHHKNLGTTIDTENTYFQPLNLKTILKLLTCYRAIMVFFNRNQNSKLEKNKLYLKSKLVFIIFHMSVFFTILKFHGFELTIVYFLSFFIFFPLFTSIRQILEHRSFNASNEINYNETNHGQTNRIFKDSIFSRYFGAAGFNKHLLHHINPNVSYTCFNELEKELVTNEKYSSQINNSKTSYTKALISLFKI